MVDEDRQERTKPGRMVVWRERYPWFDRLVTAGKRYQDQYGDYYAAAITYFSVLALVPLLMIGFAGAGFVLRGDPELLARLQTSIATAVPSPTASQMLDQVVGEAVRSAGAVGLLGLLTALYSGLGWMSNLRAALTAQWTQAPAAQSFVRRTLSDLGALLGLGVALGICFGITALGGTSRQLFTLFGLQHTVLAGVSVRVFMLLLSVAASWLVFLWVFSRLPRKPVTLRTAVWGALFAALGFEVLKQVGVFYLGSVTQSPSGAAFGPIIGLLVFANLLSRFILFVAAWMASARENQELLLPDPPGPVVISPVVRGGGSPSVRAVFGLISFGALTGWLLRRRR